LLLVKETVVPEYVGSAKLYKNVLLVVLVMTNIWFKSHLPGIFIALVPIVPGTNT